MPKAFSILSAYIADLIIILGTWLTTTLASGGSFAAITTSGALTSLAIVLVGWLILCARHFRSTGDPTPVDPPTEERPAQAPCPLPPSRSV